MKLPDVNWEDLPEEMKTRISKEEFEIDPLTPQDEYEDKTSLERHAYLDRKLMKNLDEYVALQKIHQDKKSSGKTKWQKVKKISRYFKSSLYAVKELDRDPKDLYTKEVPEEG
jgi:hypothetical protein